MIRKEDEGAGGVPRREGPYRRAADKVCIRLSEEQATLMADFAVNFGLRPTEVVRACLGACFGPEVFLGPDEKLGVVQAATYLSDGGEEAE